MRRLIAICYTFNVLNYTNLIMSHSNKVIHSIETSDGSRCVDVFQRPDATFGFEEFRRDTEDFRGWFSVGNHSNTIFKSETAALTEARGRVPWINNIVEW